MELSSPIRSVRRSKEAVDSAAAAGIAKPDSHRAVVGGPTSSPTDTATHSVGIPAPATVFFALIVVVFLWAYWPTLALMFDTWASEPDYSHGYLILPVALYFLWARRDSFPGVTLQLAWPGLIVLGLCLAVRFVSAYYFFEDLDGLSILLWVAGVVWLTCGRSVLVWALPSIGFLLFMVPLPYRIETIMSVPLQSIATTVSCWGLQLLGLPVLAEGNVILIGDDKLFVEEACSGLRIFVGIIALAYACVVVSRKSSWESMIILASVLPIAIAANSVRIIVTACLLQLLPAESEEHLQRLIHDAAGWAMIPFAASLFGGVMWYLSRVVQEVEIVDVSDLARMRINRSASTT